MPERRYSHYKQEDVWAQLYQLQHRLGVTVHDGTVYGHSVWLTWNNQQVKAVILARSSDWYAFSLNCVERFKHELAVVVCGTHDSCLDRPVLALDSMRRYDSLKMRLDSLEPAPKRDACGRLQHAFEVRLHAIYGH